MSEPIVYPRFRWVVILTVVMVSMSAMVMMLSVAPLVGVMAKDLHVPLGTISFGFMGLHSLCIAVGAFLSGLIISVLGIFGLYLGKIFDNVKNRPIYIIKNTINAEH